MASQGMWPTATARDHKGITITKNHPNGFNASLPNSVFWATPTCQEVEHNDIVLNEKGRRVSKDGKTSHSLNLADSVRLWSTPTCQDGGKATKKWRENHQNNLTAEVFNPDKKMYPTPRARDYKGGYTTDALIRNDGKSRAFDALPNAVLDGQGSEKFKGLHLNPDWVELLMGFPLDWTDIEIDDVDYLTDEFELLQDPDSYGIPRVTESKINRAARLKCLGNAVVPKIPEILGLAIMEAFNEN
jgi:DNA (cytosine-5)-methyltransferase 1